MYQFKKRNKNHKITKLEKWTTESNWNWASLGWRSSILCSEWECKLEKRIPPSYLPDMYMCTDFYILGKTIRAMGVRENDSHSMWKDMEGHESYFPGSDREIQSHWHEFSQRSNSRKWGKECQTTGSQEESPKIFINSFLALGWDIQKRAQETHKEHQLSE